MLTNILTQSSTQSAQQAQLASNAAVQQSLGHYQNMVNSISSGYQQHPSASCGYGNEVSAAAEIYEQTMKNFTAAILNDTITEEIAKEMDECPTWFMDVEDRLPNTYHEIDEVNYEQWVNMDLEHDLILSDMSLIKIDGQMRSMGGWMLVRIKNENDNQLWNNVKQIML